MNHLNDMHVMKLNRQDSEAIEENNLIEKPKHQGLISERFAEMIPALNDGASVAEDCNQIGIPPMTDISFERYVLKYSLGKAALG